MKILHPMFLLFLFAVNACGQIVVNSVITSNVEVLQKEWRVEKHNPLLDEDPLRVVEELNQAEINRRQSRRQNAIISRQASQPEAIADPIPETEAALGDISTKYIYTMKVKNTGDKAISTLIWDYVFSEPTTEKEVGRRRFVSKVNISPGKTKNLVMRTLSPPTGAINAKNAGKKLRDQYSEQIMIQVIQYEDGSKWQANETSAKQIP